MRAILLASFGSLAIQPILGLLIIAISTFPNTVFRPWNDIGNDWVFVIIVALLHLMFLGLPTFLLLKRYKKLNIFTMVFAGLVVGLVPIVLTNISSVVSGCGGTLQGSSPFFKGQILCYDGLPTVMGWLYIGFRSWVLGIHGAVGALVFYLLWLKFSLTRHSSGTPNGAP